MNSSLGPQKGKVAARVRVFQDVPHLESRIPSFQLPPHVLAHHMEPAVIFGHGRRGGPDSSLDTERTSTDGSEQSHGNGRPPVAEIFYHDVRDIEELNNQHDEHHKIQTRPVTSMDGPGDSRGLSRRGTEHRIGHQVRRQNRSMENIADDPALEITMARSRLRSTAASKKQPAPDVREPPRTRALTIDDLNTMLDDAIKSNSPKPEVSSDEQPASLAPKPGLVLRRASTRQDRERGRSPSRIRIPRRTTESVEPRTSEESIRVHYDEAEMALQRQGVGRKDAANHRDTLKAVSPATSQVRPLPVPNTQLSPVKQRAAIFESLSKKAEPLGHDSICHHFGHEHDPTHDHKHHHPGPPREKPKKVHRIKFGDRIEERPATPLIPLTLPTLVTKEKTARSPPPPEKKELQHDAEVVDEKPAPDDVFKAEAHERKSSLGWPFKWGLFNKGASAPPQESGSSQTEADQKDEHYPTTRPSVVRSKVQEILQAVEEKDDAEQRRREAEKGRMTRRNTRAAPPSRRQTVVRRVDPKEEIISGLQPLESPLNDPPQLLRLAATGDESSRTPLQSAMSEKQVLAPPIRPEQSSDSASSPRKSLPQTPVRGRPSLAYRPTPDQQHSIERQFNLSPARSASRQRQGVKVEVEIRESPEREARERGEKIVIVRADVASDMDDEER
ncbi:hypothetical protein H2200_001472 [Cladophialophora chaetospira]|uniref:Uncharacterized protein n=1 Tax=Cladophialophora chaetospira TaxID=386627 RepID=A0AA39CPM7_9EURO|nr:hypothetical protein H2200_001472 [Cladophialophora chaetospira]